VWAAGVLFVTTNGDALFCRRSDSGEWSIPAGNLEDNETPRECVVNGAGVIWELLSGVWPKFAPSGDVAPTLPGLDAPVCAALEELPVVWPKSAPSGDVAPTLPGLDVPVCAALWQTPSAVMASSTAAARKDFIWMIVR
jgi:hypothetical protein